MADIARALLNIGHHTMARFDPRYQAINRSTTVTAEALLGREKIVTPELKEEHDEKAGEGDSERLVCAICFSHRRNVVFMPCRHILTCNTCALRLESGNCPYCGQKVDSATNVRFP